MSVKPTNTRQPEPPSLRDRAAEAVDGAREKAIEAYDLARERASAAGGKAKEGLGQAPLLALGGGLAVGALIAALLPKSRIEDRLIGPVGERITDGAKAAASAATEAGRVKLTELNITRDAGTSAVQSLIDGIGEAARSSGQAAIAAVRNKD
ncbi:MAG: hypothetical protein H0W65_08775 [Sphingomonas sp.]|uniref:hypothetical protein n=1 Tax=Sphingomonas sp. TaxID=28214 RepID=UPI0017900E98|nr:hypothetical protein [Sphingomonas sp.]MBA3667801.1 hypothetical protein [Sphingomonas sp.]